MAPPRFFSSAVIAGWLLLDFGVLGGCHQASGPAATGRASFTFIEEPRRPESGAKNAVAELAQTHEVWEPAEAILPLALPIYPRIAAKDRAGWVTVSVHVTVDDRGRVNGVTPSLFGFTTPTAFAADFAAAVEAAVMQWKFRPAEVHQVQSFSGEGGRTLLNVLHVERIESAFDVSFTFTAAGDVISPRAR